ncbi:NAD-dependent epimerase/dehydratase family protein [Rhodococcus xishaensis]|uniref:NAD-dependent epimerase/dehydratase family protein n=1 Tax=Rhodococcus xishaensis TaxID=2487364 RepID=A0A3S3E2W6_9NOCA|nr:NAD-dependent epimerase/dehydratase family protein [Rhodococcus xishaensis]RVW04086.1 NAD-dependent epimerase/dehydratase family protein [Rhodococcus xishaensis]
MKILVTGASGFLGGRLARRLADDGDWDVSILVRPTSRLVDLGDLSGMRILYGDLTDSASLEAATLGVDVVVHSAARVDERGTRAQFERENVDATRVLLDAAKANGASRFVFISSPSALMSYDGGDQINLDESAPYPTRFLNLYSETKAAAEQLVLAANGDGFTTCALRPRAIWGPGDRSGPIVRLLGRARAGKLPNLSGGRDVYASLCHIDNIVDATIKAARSDSAAGEAIGGKAYFIADAEITNIWPYMAEVAKEFGFTLPDKSVNPRVVSAIVKVLDRVWTLPYLAARYSPPLSMYVLALMTRSATFDTSAAERDFGYTPVVDRATGMRQFREWVDSQGGLAELTRDLA